MWCPPKQNWLKLVLFDKSLFKNCAEICWEFRPLKKSRHQFAKYLAHHPLIQTYLKTSLSAISISIANTFKHFYTEQNLSNIQGSRFENAAFTFEKGIHDVKCHSVSPIQQKPELRPGQEVLHSDQKGTRSKKCRITERYKPHQNWKLWKN